MWVIVCDDRAHGGADPPLALYTYMPGRGAMWAKQLLGTYQGMRIPTIARMYSDLMPRSVPI